MKPKRYPQDIGSDEFLIALKESARILVYFEDVEFRDSHEEGLSHPHYYINIPMRKRVLLFEMITSQHDTIQDRADKVNHPRL